MSQDDRFEKGMEKFKEVYCGDVAPIPRGNSDFFDLMIENLFCDVWTRPALSQRDRRMLMMGAICALGESMTFGIQAKAALKNDPKKGCQKGPSQIAFCENMYVSQGFRRHLLMSCDLVGVPKTT